MTITVASVFPNPLASVCKIYLPLLSSFTLLPLFSSPFLHPPLFSFLTPSNSFLPILCQILPSPSPPSSLHSSLTPFLLLIPCHSLPPFFHSFLFSSLNLPSPIYLPLVTPFPPFFSHPHSSHDLNSLPPFIPFVHSFPPPSQSLIPLLLPSLSSHPSPPSILSCQLLPPSPIPTLFSSPPSPSILLPTPFPPLSSPSSLFSSLPSLYRHLIITPFRLLPPYTLSLFVTYALSHIKAYKFCVPTVQRLATLLTSPCPTLLPPPLVSSRPQPPPSSRPPRPLAYILPPHAPSLHAPPAARGPHRKVPGFCLFLASYSILNGFQRLTPNVFSSPAKETFDLAARDGASCLEKMKLRFAAISFLINGTIFLSPKETRSLSTLPPPPHPHPPSSPSPPPPPLPPLPPPPGPNSLWPPPPPPPLPPWRPRLQRSPDFLRRSACESADLGALLNRRGVISTPPSSTGVIHYPPHLPLPLHPPTHPLPFHPSTPLLHPLHPHPPSPPPPLPLPSSTPPPPPDPTCPGRTTSAPPRPAHFLPRLTA
ncbi:hypothetical protein C7M84_021103 [Penaeus vannamei]|uniref:Uncharacterized protein n=1 Tax=Penaeus vannamei TaxID=6689 RepID=A0A3R7MGF8_PENVA|nr:hypothetical protein C7M84_021103 [Penaeus vannamei]